MKFLKALVVLMVISLPFIYGYNIYSRGTWAVASKVTPLGQLPSEVRESSGITLADEAGTYFTHNDHGAGGAAPVLFKVSETGKLIKTYTISGASNEDWEDIASDNKGNVYIADTGNNSGKRTELKIYKVNAAAPSKPEVISFTYGDKPEAGTSKKGKKSKKAQSFDSEAIFWDNGNLYLITKDRNNSNEARLYVLPDSPGSHTAKLVSAKPINEKITGASLSPDGNRLALMSVGKLHLFNVSGSDYFRGNPQTVSLGNVGQTEGLVFKDNSTLIFTNEAGQIFRYNF